VSVPNNVEILSLPLHIRSSDSLGTLTCKYRLKSHSCSQAWRGVTNSLLYVLRQ